MNFGQAFEEVKKGKGMRLPYWKEGLAVYMWNPQTSMEEIENFFAMKIFENVRKKHGFVPCEYLWSNKISKVARIAKENMDSVSHIPYLYICDNEIMYPEIWKESLHEFYSEEWEVVD